LRRHFHSIAIALAGVNLSLCDELPLIVYGNHPSWWDPLIAQFLNRSLFPNRQFYAPIDAEALENYRVFSRLGFYGVRLQSARGAADFLRQTNSILHSPNTSVWLTPEGRFADVRDHGADLMPGLAHLCTRLDRGIVLPLVLEYPFWFERLPECLAMLGEPFLLRESSTMSKPQWQAQLTQRLRSAQQSLMQLSIARQDAAFEHLLRGKSGTGAAYDWARRLRSWMSRKTFRRAHGEAFE
jgi:1-acyl-sn-glycerol-3-phosphate acyltransferase